MRLDYRDCDRKELTDLREKYKNCFAPIGYILYWSEYTFPKYAI